MRSVLFVLPSTAIGGAETRYATLMNQMRRLRPVVMTYRFNEALFEGVGVSAHYFEDFHCPPAMPITVSGVWAYARAIRAVVKKERIDLIFGVMHIGTFYAALARDLWLHRMPVIGSVLGHLSSYFKTSGHLPTRLESASIRYLVRRPHRLIVSSSGVREDLIDSFSGSFDRVKVIPNGIHLDRVRHMALELCPELPDFSGKTIVTVSRLCPGKDFGTLLSAMALLRREKIPVRLVIVGEGEFREPLEAMVLSEGLQDAVLMVGFQVNPFRFVGKADLFILSSFHEGFGNVLVEAMALGIPVISSDCPTGPREIITSGETGYLFPIGDHEALANLVTRLFDDRSLFQKISQGGLAASERFSAQNMVDRYEDLMQEVLGDQPSGNGS